MTSAAAPTAFGPRSIRVGEFLLDRRRRGADKHAVSAFEALHERFPDLTFFDFLGGLIYADCAEAGTLRVCSQEAGHA